ncbi:hypothetical protein PC128_g7979 [Phytophthora cactorum]|nr:hypothetical protein PC120_g17422 [Phytophthora cactorum]KAG3196025.1 hypothetical protein PC128_g7979 [Phytophthora cactorum]KAG4052045.1 hypothetical protein PC123_g12760 [Phytophthora cactorum]
MKEAINAGAEVCSEDEVSVAEVSDQETVRDGVEVEAPSCWAIPGTPVPRLEQEYGRCMRANKEYFDLEPAIYVHEGSELLSQLRDELAMIPELKGLSPECDISTAMLVPLDTPPRLVKSDFDPSWNTTK